jgi:outer membrane protein assembly factor BamE (lipoprotein component of BamABCDE complex)
MRGVCAAVTVWHHGSLICCHQNLQSGKEGMARSLVTGSKYMAMPSPFRQSLRRYVTAGAAALLVLSLGGCERKVETHGTSLEPEEVARIVTGTHTKADVAELLGSPSSTAVFDDETWYYISDQVEPRSFLDPKVLDRTVVAVHFDAQGVATSIEKIGLDRGREVEMVQRETPSFGLSPSLVQQLLGNLGRFNKENQPQR